MLKLRTFHKIGGLFGITLRLHKGIQKSKVVDILLLSILSPKYFPNMNVCMFVNFFQIIVKITKLFLIQPF